MNGSILAIILVYNFTKSFWVNYGIEAIPVNKLIIHFGTTVLVLGTGLIWWKMKLIGFDLLLGIFTKMAPISYALYVFHFPILAQWDLYQYVDYNINTVNIIWINVVRLIALVGLSYWAEIKLQPIINKLITTK